MHPTRPYAIAFLCDEEFSSGLLTALSSVLAFSQLDAFTIYIGYDSQQSTPRFWEQALQLLRKYNFPTAMCHLIPLPLDQLDHYEALEGTNYCTIGRYLLIERIDAEYVIYLDSDTLIVEDLTQLIQEASKTHPLSAVQDQTLKVHQNDPYKLNDQKAANDTSAYLNAGVMVINIRKFGKLKVMSSFEAMKQRISCVKYSDQTYLNVALKDQWYQLHGRWNILTQFRRPARLKVDGRLVAIFHYTSRRKPWNHAALDLPNIYWHSIARANGIEINPEIYQSFEGLVASHRCLNRIETWMRALIYACIPSKRSKAKNLFRLLGLRSELKKVQARLLRHNLGPIPAPFAPLLTNQK